MQLETLYKLFETVLGFSMIAAFSVPILMIGQALNHVIRLRFDINDSNHKD